MSRKQAGAGQETIQASSNWDTHAFHSERGESEYKAHKMQHHNRELLILHELVQNKAYKADAEEENPKKMC